MSIFTVAFEKKGSCSQGNCKKQLFTIQIYVHYVICPKRKQCVSLIDFNELSYIFRLKCKFAVVEKKTDGLRN
jgi:hypothetical protein